VAIEGQGRLHGPNARGLSRTAPGPPLHRRPEPAQNLVNIMDPGARMGLA
jgi:hypothetical protein